MTAHITRRQALTGLALASVAPAWAQPPSRPLRLLVGYPPGGGADVIARLMAERLRGKYAPNVMVENRAGAGGRIALDALRRAEPDGTTAAVTPDFPLTVFPHLYRKLGYDPVTDFAPVSMCGVSDFAICVGPAVPASITNIESWLRWCQSNPANGLYASPAPGSTPHFTGEMLSRAAQVSLTHVAYKGGAQAIQDLLGGQVPASINPIGEVLPHASSGKLRVLATAGAVRSGFLPTVPTLREAGFRSVVTQSWIGVLAPAAVPKATLAAMDAAVREALKAPSVVDGFAKFGITVAWQPAERFAAVLNGDLARWRDIVKASSFTVEE